MIPWRGGRLKGSRHTKGRKKLSSPVPSTVLPEALRRRMALAGFLPRIRGIIKPTIEMAVARYLANRDSPGWIDMKFDPVDGKERDPSRDCYRRDRVYAWIQGRALESLTAHLRWTEAVPGYDTLDREKLLAVAESLYAKLLGTCFPPSGLKVYFAMDPSGAPASRDFGAGKTTLSRLFVLRGLLAYAGYREYSADIARIAPALRAAVDASVKGECLNDQTSFGEGGGLSYPAERKGYEGQMISIGASELLFTVSKAEEDLSRGLEVIRTLLEAYVVRGLGPGTLMIDALDKDGRPLREDGRLKANPGHALEFVGLALQFFRSTAEASRDPASTAAMIEVLRDLAFRYHDIGRAPHGGIVGSLDAETGLVLRGDCPWWSSFEAVRTFAELCVTESDEEGKRRCVDRMGSYLDCIEAVYLKPSSIGIPVQTVSFSGAVVPVIPATPDIDAGYHTGMPLLDVYEIAGIEGTMLYGSAEAEIPARLGVRLQGHVARTGLADREIEPLRVRCRWFASASTQALFLSADVLEFSRRWSEAFAAELSVSYGVPEGNIFLLATHTHTAPCAIDLGTLKSDAVFLASLESTMRDTIVSARDCMTPAVGTLCATTMENIGVNRRFLDPETGTVEMRPNLKGENDDELNGFFVFDDKGSLKTAIANMATHPTTLGVSIHGISADYPGRVAAHLRKTFGPGLVAIPIQGACGDIRPMILDGTKTEFAEGGEGDIERMGEAIARRLTAAFAGMMKEGPRWIEGGRLSVSTREIDLPFAFLPTRAGLEALAARAKAEIALLKTSPPEGKGFAGSHESPLLTAETDLAWARGLLGTAFDASGVYIGPVVLRARFSLFSLGGSLLFFTLPGEAFCRIGKTLRLRALPSDLIVCGYAGGSVGYMPTKAAFAEGGYEVEAAYRFYGLPAPLSPDIEDTIYGLFDSMKQEVGICQR